MKIEIRRRLHADHISYHNELILTPTKQEAKALDKAFPKLAEKEYGIRGIIKTDDYFNTYIRFVSVPKYIIGATEKYPTTRKAKDDGLL